MKNQNIDIWGDYVRLRDLIISIAITAVLTMGCYFLAPNNDTTKQLFYGLGGAVLGFIISTLVISPKRVVTEVSASEEKAGDE
ncbi:MAG: hypothetical protein LBM95_08505 [Lactobacillales bacterium]|jgi:uncharacterized BrkB/YihY/UPF0761 family membrane protein|nr:hypothetical protein [Lactobacillales bacterium]